MMVPPLRLGLLLLAIGGIALGCGAKSTQPAAVPEREAPPLAAAASPGDPASCKAQEFEYSIPSCCSGQEVYWNGTACESALPRKCGCVCAGPDCGKQFTSLEACNSAYAHCSAR